MDLSGKGGDFMITVVVSDGNGGAAKKSVIINVPDKPNNPPVITAIKFTRPSHLPVTIRPNMTDDEKKKLPELVARKYVDTCDISCVATDPDGDKLDYIWQATGGKIIGSGPNIQWIAARPGHLHYQRGSGRRQRRQHELSNYCQRTLLQRLSVFHSSTNLISPRPPCGPHRSPVSLFSLIADHAVMRQGYDREIYEISHGCGRSVCQAAEGDSSIAASATPRLKEGPTVPDEVHIPTGILSGPISTASFPVKGELPA